MYKVSGFYYICRIIHLKETKMSHCKLNSILIAIAASLCLISCKDDDETTATPSLDGALSFNVPAYVVPGTSVTMTPSGVEHPDGEELGYYWKVTPTQTKADTTRFQNGLDKNGNPSDGSFTFTFPDTLQTYTVQGYAFATGYTYATKSIAVKVVKGGVDGSITNLGLAEMSTATVNGKAYPYVTINGTDWLCRNISDENAGTPYGNYKAMSDVFGRYYSYEEALSICPEGWRLPTDAEWTAAAAAYDNKIAALMGNGYFNDELMWEYWPTVGDINNASGLSLIPVGYSLLSSKAADPKQEEYIDGTYPQAQFKGYTEYAVFWTADPVEDEEGMAYYRYIICDQPDFMLGKGDAKTFGASVRCVR